MLNLTNNNIPNLEKSWTDPKTKEPYGTIDIGEVSPASINYVTGYLINDYQDYLITQRPFALMSKGIGKNYLIKNERYHRENNRHYAQYGNGKIALPRYYRNKFFSAEEKRVHSEKMAEQLAEKELVRFDNQLSKGLSPWDYRKQQIAHKKQIIQKTINDKKL